MAITRRVEIHAPIDRVFDLVSRPENLVRWIDGLESTEYVGGADPDNPIGTRFRQRIREGGRTVEYDGEITAYEKPHHLAVSIGNRRFAMHVDYHLAENGEGTVLDYRVAPQAKGPLARVMTAMFRRLTGRIADRQLARLREVAQAA
jgi:carbon monoxide dehydrogenase subunit G